MSSDNTNQLKPKFDEIPSIHLPDTAFLIIFGELTKADLKSARLVEKRWNGLVKPSLLYDRPTLGDGKTTLSHFEAIASHPVYSNVVTEATVELGFEYDIWDGTTVENRRGPTFDRLVQSLERFHKLKTFKLIVKHDYPEDRDFDHGTYESAPVSEALKALKNPMCVTVEHWNWADNSWSLSEDFGDNFDWPSLTSLTLSGLTVPNERVFLECLAPFKSSLCELHIRNFNIVDHNDVWESGKWELILKALRDDYTLNSFTIDGFYADQDLGDGPQCGRWQVYKPHDGSYDLANFGPILDIEKIQELIAAWVLGGEGNPFQLYMMPSD
ncbi:hypothetical protein PV08_05041 [Exophiala spinifera]|uniref:F-box domain-containing protein n=1 Tax=Exophiala spinifera TaxID=91928 RepID=A0A0D1YRG2_9EURO|nr:uncharacterized protein PV08_05041 [Exophiala spinifera]KIW17846.1 hypothetical protein PV08_05041 [Exophiala spinifera]